MTLTVSRSGDQYVLSGVAKDSTATAPLGQRYFKVGAHWVGFDDKFIEPVIVRAYYDPADPDAHRVATLAAYTGYVQVMQISFANLGIPPEVYGGRLADRQVYVYGDEQCFLDFMGPASAKAQDVKRPLYPYNAMLTDGRLYEDYQFCAAGLANGSLYGRGDYRQQLNDQLGLPQSAVASLVAEIAPSLVTSDDVKKAVDEADEIVALEPSLRELAAKEAYRYALDWLETTPLKGESVPFLDGLDESQVVAELIGGYVLLTLPGPDGPGMTLVIYTEDRLDRGPLVHVRALSDYDVEAMADKAGQLFWRLREYQLSKDQDKDQGDEAMPDGGEQPSQGWGHSGLWSPPEGITPGQPGVVKLQYWTVPVAYREMKGGRKGPVSLVPHALDAITWAVLFEYSGVTEQLTLSSIGAPERDPSFRIWDALDAYDKALRAGSAATAFIDISNFTKAAMRRDSFAPGQLRFVDRTGKEVPQRGATSLWLSCGPWSLCAGPARSSPRRGRRWTAPPAITSR